MSRHDVEFVINTFERNIDAVTAPGFLADAAAQNCDPFAQRTPLLNNVQASDATARLATGAVDRGEIDRFLFVEDLLDLGLHVNNLRRRDFGRYLHWSDCRLAALVTDDPPWLCHVDVDVRLAEPQDWVTQALAVMSAAPRAPVGNPNWVMADCTSTVHLVATVHLESDLAGDGYASGYGISDQIFLVRRSTFGTDGSLFFEQIADA